MPRRGWVAALVLASLAGLPASAPAQDQSFRSAGSVVVNWRAVPERGCEAAGLCGLSGQLRLPLSGDGHTFESEGGLDPEFLSGVARVERSSEGPCIELLDFDRMDAMALAPVEGDRTKLRVVLAPDVSAARCGGPTSKDLFEGLPKLTMPAGVARRGGRAFLGGRFPFQAGPFAGEVISDWVLRFNRPRGEDETTSGGDEPAAPPRHERQVRRIRVADFVVEYGVRPVKSTLTTKFGALPSPFCRAFDACGLSGTNTLELTAAGGSLIVTGSRRLDDNERVSVRSELAALRAGRAGMQAFLSLERTSLAYGERVTGTGGADCTDSATPTSVELQASNEGRRRVRLRVGDFFDVSFSSLAQGRCPGPSTVDVLGSEVLARAVLSASNVGPARGRLTLLPKGGFSAGVYGGNTTGGITLELVRERIRATARTVER